jgi:menaquinone-dependent protoporphyrinogen IX oxidase
MVMVNSTNVGQWLVAYYSRSGNTRSVARELAARIGADVLEIHSARPYQDNALGYIRAAFDTGMQRQVGFKLENPPVSLSKYAGVVLASPVWMSSLAPPLQSFARAYARDFKQVAFLTTMGGSGADRAFKQLEEICEKAPISVLAVNAKEMRRSETEALGHRLDDFSKSLNAAFRQKVA